MTEVTREGYPRISQAPQVPHHLHLLSHLESHHNFLLVNHITELTTSSLFSFLGVVPSIYHKADLRKIQLCPMNQRQCYSYSMFLNNSYSSV